MASLYRPTVIRYFDAEGRQVSKSQPNARRERVKSKTWWGKFKDANGEPQRVPLDADRETAESMLANHIQRVRDERAGVVRPVDPYEAHTAKPLADHIDDFRRHLESKNCSEKHITKTIGYLSRVATDCGFQMLAHIDHSAIENYLAEHRERERWYCPKCQRFWLDECETCPAGCAKGSKKQKLHRRSPLSKSAANGYLTACGTFGNWLMKRRRVPENPFRGLEKLDAQTDRRRIRRAAADDEFFRLLAAAANGPAFRGLLGEDRVAIYLVAVNTGFRVSELASLTAGSFDFSQEPASVAVDAAHAKNKRTTRQPLQSDVAGIVREWIKNRSARLDEESPVVPIRKPATAPLWPGTWTEKAAVMLRKDLKAARDAWIAEVKTEAERKDREESATLRYFDDQGHVLDFHALRHTFGTNLARCGVHPRTAQELMRHSDINLTMQTYTHVRLHDLNAAVESLPNLAALPQGEESAEAMAAGSESNPAPPISVVPKVVPAPPNINDSQSVAMGDKPPKRGGDQTTQAPEKSGACEDSCEPLKAIEQEPLDRFELSTYALRMRRSAS